MKVGIYSPYFDIFGGGERYVLSVAEFFQNRGDSVTVFSGDVLDVAKVQSRFDLNLNKIHFGSWPGTLGTAVYDFIFFLSDGSLPTLLSRKNILLFQQPFTYTNQRTLGNKLKLARVQTVLCYSFFAKKFLDKTYGVSCQVLYPPVDVVKFSPGKKENIILSAGRFFVQPHAKKQEEMVRVFKEMVDDGLRDWRLVLVGGLAEVQKDKLDLLLKEAKGYPIEVVSNVEFDQLQGYYSRAKIFWHAAGFGENLIEHPEKAEHFGITTVEAMAAGAVPVVFQGGGQPEIVTEAKNGFLWETGQEWKEKTTRLIKDKKLMETLREKAIVRSKDFSKEAFFQNLSETII